MFNRFFSGNTKQEVFFDVEETIEHQPLLGVTIEKGEQLENLLTEKIEKEQMIQGRPINNDKEFNDAPEFDITEIHQPQRYLEKEILACIYLLNEAKNQARLNTHKLNKLQYYYRCIYLIQLSLSISMSLGSTGSTVFLTHKWLNLGLNKAKQAAESLSAKISNLVNFTTQVRNNISYNQNNIPDNLFEKLQTRFDIQSAWWTRPADNEIHNSSLNYDHHITLKQLYSDTVIYGSCSIWRIYEKPFCFNNLNYLSDHFDNFDGTNFCKLQNDYLNSHYKYQHPFIECDQSVAKICELDNDIQANIASNSPIVQDLLNLEHQASRLALETNQLLKGTNRPSAAVAYTAASSISFLLLSGGSLLIWLYVSRFNKALAEYKDDLLHAHDLERCITDPKILNRLINLTTRLGISFKDATADSLITALEDQLTELRKRRYDRLNILSALQLCSIKLNLSDHQPLQDLMPLIFDYAEIHPKHQAPRLGGSRED